MAEIGVFILAEITGQSAAEIAALQREFDPRQVSLRGAPHITLAGSSGVGPAHPDTPVQELRAALEPVAAASPPLALPLEPPHRFMQTNIVVLPLNPNGPIRELHNRIIRSGIRFGRARFTFSPHVTISLYPTLAPEQLRRLLAIRIADPVHITSISAWLTRDPLPGRKLLELPLTG